MGDCFKFCGLLGKPELYYIVHSPHTDCSRIIKQKKCGGMGLNGFLPQMKYHIPWNFFKISANQPIQSGPEFVLVSWRFESDSYNLYSFIIPRMRSFIICENFGPAFYSIFWATVVNWNRIINLSNYLFLTLFLRTYLHVLLSYVT